MDLSLQDSSRYQSQISLEEVGNTGQIKIRSACILVVGAGGLGCPVLQYLAAAGIGNIGIIDGDRVMKSNLNRQVLYQENDTGRLKVEAAREKLLLLNSEIQYVIYPEMLSPENAENIISQYEIIIDCTDQLDVRYLIDDVCMKTHKIMIYGALHKFQGQVSVFHYPDEQGIRFSYRDLFPEIPSVNQIPGCGETGVLGVIPGIIGSLQAAQALKIVLRMGDILSGKLFMFDAASFTSMILTITKSKIEPQVGLEGSSRRLQTEDFEIDLDGEQNSLAKDYIFIDIREKNEAPLVPSSPMILSIPTSDINFRNAIQNSGKKLVLFCNSGKRSYHLVKELRADGNFKNVFSLKGGIRKNSALFNQIKSV